ncbi:MAG: alpha/beta hydrolase [Myxococcota bacterium]
MRLLTTLTLVTLVACTGGTVGETQDPTNPTQNPEPPTTRPSNPTAGLGWAACEPLTSSMKPGPECATWDVPLRWAEADTDPTIAFTVYRYVSDQAGDRGQVWLLDGGPGGTGAGPGATEVVNRFTAEGWDVYIPSQRGTSGVDELRCTSQDPEACHAELVDEWSLAGLAGFTTHEAALDTQNALADADDGRPQLLFGTSYGTYLAMRILQIDDEIDGVILDSSMTYAPDIWRAGVYTDDLMWALFASCAADSDCADRFPVPVEEAVALVSDPNHCSDLDVEGRGGTIAQTVNLSPAVPLALTSRLARCAPEDVQALDRLGSLFSGGPSLSWYFEGALNQNVYLNVVAHDFLPPFREEVRDDAIAEAAGLAFGNDSAARTFWQNREQWPVVKGFVADTSVPDAPPPVLVLQGAMDLQTPVAWGETAADDLNGTIVTFPQIGHGVFPQDNCAQSISMAFLADPSAPLDTSCADALPGPDLTGADDPYVGGFINFALGLSELWPTL